MELGEIIFDSCFLKTKEIKDFSKFLFHKNFYDFIDFLGTNDLLEKYTICIPEIVIKELEKQQKDLFSDEIDVINKSILKLNRIYELTTIEKQEYEKLLGNAIKYEIEENNLQIIPITKDKDCFKKIINRAIDKRKPFSGKETESDKGFKDCLQWESIINYAIVSELSQFFYFTKNRNDFVKDLEIEFNERTNKKLTIFYELDQLQKEVLNQNSINSKIELVKSLIDSDIETGLLLNMVNMLLSLEFNMKIISIIGMNDLIDQGNNYFIAIIESFGENNAKYQLSISCELDEDGNMTYNSANLG